MRIGLDLIALQSESRRRGIGRYSLALASSMMSLDRSVEYVLYVHEGLPDDLIPSAPNATTVVVGREPDRGEREIADVVDRLARENPHDLDALLLLSPFDQHPGYDPPAKPLNNLKMAAVLYDLIPFIFQEKYLDEPGHADRFYRFLGRLRKYDALLAISDSTRADCQQLLATSPGHVVTISGACDSRFFTPDHPGPPSPDSLATLDRLGVRSPFVFCLSGWDDRKNWRGLIDAFSLLPPALRQTHQLVVACSISEASRSIISQHSDSRGVGDRVVLTGAVTDEDLRILYRRCAVFCFPSSYEGFGLPPLEAMHCGAAVVAGNNSSLVEVVGDAGLLANSADPSDIAAKLETVLSDAGLADRLRGQALIQASRFSWERTGGLALESVRGLVEGRTRNRRLRVDGSHPSRPRLAVFSPFPPKKSGISDYSARLVQHLSESYAIHLYHEPGYIPETAIASPDFGAFDHRLFARNAAQVGYRAVLHQMGNSQYHRFIYESILRHPGIVTLHDFGIPGFHWWYSKQAGVDPDHFRREIEHSEPDRAARIMAELDAWDAEPGHVPEACTRRGVPLNRRIFEAAERVVLHSPWCSRQVDSLFPEYSEKTRVVPMGATSRSVSAEERAALRARFDLPIDGLLIGSFGVLHANKMNVPAIDAFARIVAGAPSARLVFVGQDLGLGEARRRVDELGLGDRVRFLGRQPTADFLSLIGCVDIGVSLRLPPTNGETSAALLDLLGVGIPTIVTDVATFSDYPASVVRKVRWDDDGPAELARVMLELATDRTARESLRRSSLRYVRERHEWPIAAKAYSALIEECHRERRGAGVGVGPIGRVRDMSPRIGLGKGGG